MLTGCSWTNQNRYRNALGAVSGQVIGETGGLGTDNKAGAVVGGNGPGMGDQGVFVKPDAGPARRTPDKNRFWAVINRRTLGGEVFLGHGSVWAIGRTALPSPVISKVKLPLEPALTTKVVAVLEVIEAAYSLFP